LAELEIQNVKLKVRLPTFCIFNFDFLIALRFAPSHFHLKTMAFGKAFLISVHSCAGSVGFAPNFPCKTVALVLLIAVL
jgi:hypothetical protein